MKDLFKNLLPLAAKWKSIGVLLGVKDNILQEIRRDEGDECQDCLREMLSQWLKTVNPPPAWSSLVEVIEALGDPARAQQIRNYIAE